MAEYNVGDKVRIKTGAFASFGGEVESVSAEGLLLKVAITVYGRTTSLDLMSSEVEEAGFSDPGWPNKRLSNN